MYIAETEEAWWKEVPYGSIDRLIIGPLGIQDNNGTFGLLPAMQAKFQRVLDAARAANPSISVLGVRRRLQGEKAK
jgi:hypothetical protein